MTYQEITATREARRAAYLATPRCAGCCRTFESYGMKPAEGFKADSKVYCNSDCHDAAEVSAMEDADYASLAEEY